jgi:hypothetical protein
VPELAGRLPAPAPAYIESGRHRCRASLPAAVDGVDGSVAVGAAARQHAGDGDRSRVVVEQDYGAPVAAAEAALGEAGQLAQRAYGYQRRPMPMST